MTTPRETWNLDPAHIVESFLATCADAIIRRDVSTDEFFDRAHQKAAEPDAPPELRWLSALLASDPHLKGGDVLDHDFLLDHVRSWIGKLNESTAAAPARLCLLLEEPDEEPEDPLAIEAALASDSPDTLVADTDETTDADFAQSPTDHAPEHASGIDAIAHAVIGLLRAERQRARIVVRSERRLLFLRQDEIEWVEAATKAAEG